MEFTSDEKVREVRALTRTDAPFKHVLYDEEPVFIGDEASILDVSAAPTEGLVKRCSDYYRTPVSVEDLRSHCGNSFLRWRAKSPLKAGVRHVHTPAHRPVGLPLTRLCRDG